MAKIVPDLDVLGVFQQKSYTNVGDPYKSRPQFTTSRKPIDPSKPKWYAQEWHSKKRAGNRDGYFDEFKRVFTGESYNSRFKLAMQHKIDSKKKNIGAEWKPASGIRSMDSLGSTSGLIDETFVRLERGTKPRQRVKEGKNFYVGPLKQGIGYGYLDVCINPYPEWMPGAVPPFKTARKEKGYTKEWNPGGKYPSYIDEKGIQGNNVFAPYTGPAQSLRKGGGPNLNGNWIPNSFTKFPCGLGSQCVMLNKYPEHSANKFYEPWKISRMMRADEKSKNVGGEWYPPKTCALNIPSKSVVNKNIDLHHNSQNYKKTLAVWCTEENKLIAMTANEKPKTS